MINFGLVNYRCVMIQLTTQGNKQYIETVRKRERRNVGKKKGEKTRKEREKRERKRERRQFLSNNNNLRVGIIKENHLSIRVLLLMFTILIEILIVYLGP